MRIRILGGGWYGCHLSAAFMDRGHAVELHESADYLFSGASGSNPARLHLGFHYPRSRLTRAMCQEHYARFMRKYGFLTAGIPVNIYAVAAGESLVDFGNYVQTLRGEVEFVTIARPDEFGLRSVEGAVLTGERHIIIDLARDYFTNKLAKVARYNVRPDEFRPSLFDRTIDCTFCSNHPDGVDRYEPCITGMLKGPTDKAVTIMDGPFPSVYPWNESLGLSSLTSALHTPLARCKTWVEARDIIAGYTEPEAKSRVHLMLSQMSTFWPEVTSLYCYAGYRTGIRAMPRSGSDARLVDVVEVDGHTIRVRAGKIDAVLHAEALIAEMMGCS